MSIISSDSESYFRQNEKPYIIYNNSVDSLISSKYGREKVRTALKLRHGIATLQTGQQCFITKWIIHITNNIAIKHLFKSLKWETMIIIEWVLLNRQNKIIKKKERKSWRKRAQCLSPQARATLNLDCLCLIYNLRTDQKYRTNEWPKADEFLEAALYL